MSKNIDKSVFNFRNVHIVKLLEYHSKGEKNSMKKAILLLFISMITLGIIGCTVNVKPVLNSSLSMDAFKKMGKIELHDTRIALYIDQKMKELNANQTIKMGNFSFDLGDAFSVKLIKALAYNFKTIYFLDQPTYAGAYPVDAIMYVNLQDADVNLGIKTGFSTVSTEAYTRLSIRAEIKDAEENKTIWVGTTQAKESGSHEEKYMTYQEAGRGYAIAIDNAIDKAIGDLINDMSKSQNLQLYIAKWEQRHKGDTHVSK